MKTVNYISVVAERNTGSNWLCFLIDKNLSVEQGWRHGFKHWVPLKNLGDSDDTLFVVLVKNPYSWLVSMRDMPHHAMQLKGLSLGDFVSRKWPKSYGKNKADIQGRHAAIERNAGLVLDEEFPNIIQMRNHKNHYLLDLPSKAKHVEFVRYEDLLVGYGAKIRELADKYGLSIKGTEIVGHDRFFIGGGVRSTNFTETDYYLRGEYMQEFSGETLDFVNSELSWGIERALGYERVGP